MRFLKKILPVMLVMGTLAVTTSVKAAADAPKPAMVKKEAAKDLILKGDAKCTSCHDEADEPKLLSIAVTRHGVKGDSRTPTCVKCHGESDAHVNHKGSDKPPAVDRSFRKNTPTAAAERDQTCIACHKGDKRTHWEGSAHANNEVSCNSCHKVHAERDPVRDKKTQGEVCFTCHKTERADIHRVSTHPLAAGKMACSDCHNSHGSAGPKMLKKNTLNETCFTCHAEKRGPFLWEHQGAAENCSNCHQSHGSNISPLLKSRAPWLCNECHDGPHASKSPTARNAAGIQGGLTPTIPSESFTGRACLNCHSMIHGSNHPAGALLHR